jgi:hypothetical protein
MRTLIAIILVVVVLVAAAAVYLAATTPRSGDPLRFPITAQERELLGHVPASAEAFALIPAAGLLQVKLLSNRVARDAALRWTEEHELPRPWMLGGADIVVWKQGGTTTYAVRLDRFRALLLRIWLLVASNVSARWDGSTLIMNEPAGALPGEGSTDLDDVLQLSAGLPEADVLVVQRRSDRGAFPPIGRPAITSIRVTPKEITTISRASAAAEPFAREPFRASFPEGAMLTAAFSDPPRMVSDLHRLIGTRIDALLEEGGTVALYDVDSGTLLPRPRGVVLVPRDDRRRALVRGLLPLTDFLGETRELEDQILIALDRRSMASYLADTFVPATWPATQWALRIDPERMAPILRRAGDSTGLRIATPRLHRGARDLRQWIGALEMARSFEAAASSSGGIEELRVRVESK